MNVAIVHYWLVGMRGGEKVVEALCRLFPEATIFTHVYAPDAVSDLIRSRDVRTSFIDRLPRSRRLYKSYLPLMPLALEQLDLRKYDLIISSEAGPAKGIVPPPDSVHVCYCHSPMRYIWSMFHDYRDSTGPLKRLLMPPLAHYLRNWDAVSAMRVDEFIANSTTVQARIRRYYHRDAHVVPPPVDIDAFEPVHPSQIGDFHLMVGELVRYKRPELAVEAFNRLGKRLIVIGGGEMLDELKRIAGPTITLMGPQPFPVLRHYYARCRALVFPGEEDFGIVPVEAMASGRPVIAFGRGGATETVEEGLSGTFFGEQSVDALIGALETSAHHDYDSDLIAERARQFSAERFAQSMRQHIDRLLAERNLSPSRPKPPLRAVRLAEKIGPIRGDVPKSA